MTVHYEVRDRIAIVTLDNPPVNSLGLAVRKGILAALDRAGSDAAVVAIVLTGAGRAFSAGADINEFSSGKSLQAPSLWTVLEDIEGSAKPVVAAIHTLALGGGLELALAAHYRVAAPGSKVGLPEVNIGILPGAGGTQRLPRAIGLEQALSMITSGEPVLVDGLAQTRFLDRLVEADLLTGAIAFAHEVASRKGPHPRIRDWAIEHPNAEGFLEFARPLIAAQSANVPAPLKCFEAVAATATKPFEVGLQIERDGFNYLVGTPQSKSLRHAFFSERAASKIPDLPENIQERPIRSVGVIGAGTMGRGIAINYLNVGIPVTLVDATQQALEQGVANIRATYESSLKKGQISRQILEERLGLLQSSLLYGDLRTADLIIEAVFEDYGVKEAVFKQLDAIAKSGAILATNTSNLDVNRIAAVTGRPRDVLGLHFFSPANVMKLLEVVRGAQTAPDVLATAMSMARKIGKTAVVARVCDGFIGNRMLDPYIQQATLLLEEGALPGEVDQAIEQFGFAMGPFRMLDLAGNDIAAAGRKRRAAEDPNLIKSKIPDRMCALGRFGQKTGAGWYDYRPGDRKAYPSRDIEQLILDESRTLGLERRTIPAPEIVSRLVYALVNEGARVLEEGIALRASDVDVVYLKGYGFPAWRGGPLFYADTVGIFNVVRAMNRYARGRHGEVWEPAPLLVRLAESGGTLNP
jgi:3-hydroxyacyl-CoA dehydrogenase